MQKQSVINGLVRSAFVLATVAATAPMWQRAIYGLNPTLDDLLRVALCRTVGFLKHGGPNGPGASPPPH